MARTPELILPRSDRPDDEGALSLPAFYDMGLVEIPPTYRALARTQNYRMSLALDAALLGVKNKYEAGNTAEWYNSALQNMMLWIDDFVLVPADSFIHFALPKTIQGNERAEIYIDETGNATGYIVDRNYPEDDNKKTCSSLLASFSSIQKIKSPRIVFTISSLN